MTELVNPWNMTAEEQVAYWQTYLDDLRKFDPSNAAEITAATNALTAWQKRVDGD